MKTVLAIDCNFFCHRAKYHTRGLAFKGKKTGVIYGFLASLLGIAESFKPDAFVFIWDSKASFRRRIYPEYKETRRKEKSAEDEYLDMISYPQFDELRDKILPTLGFSNIFSQIGMEGDDILAMVSKKDDMTIIVARDNDLLQLLSPTCSIYDPINKNILTDVGFAEEYGISPSQWVDVKAMAGCSTDNVAGIKGIGEKTAIKYILGQLKDTSSLKKRIESDEGQEIIMRNYTLVRLPFDRISKVIDLDIVYHDRLNREGFADICYENDLRTFLSSIPRWIKAFG